MLTIKLAMFKEGEKDELSLSRAAAAAAAAAAEAKEMQCGDRRWCSGLVSFDKGFGGPGSKPRERKHLTTGKGDEHKKRQPSKASRPGSGHTMLSCEPVQ